MRTICLCLVFLTVVLMKCAIGFAQVGFDAWSNGTTEARLKSIYDSGEYSPNRFVSEWWPNSAGYTLDERDPKTGQSIKVHYDSSTGNRVNARSSEKRVRARSRISPDGSFQIDYSDGNLVVRNLGTGKVTQLAEKASGREIGYRDPQWSFDGSHIAFI
ncbi:MAG: hypothetical protein ACPHO8_19045, partial [Mariniblastus sp.]